MFRIISWFLRQLSQWEQTEVCFSSRTTPGTLQTTVSSSTPSGSKGRLTATGTVRSDLVSYCHARIAVWLRGKLLHQSCSICTHFSNCGCCTTRQTWEIGCGIQCISIENTYSERGSTIQPCWCIGGNRDFIHQWWRTVYFLPGPCRINQCKDEPRMIPIPNHY